MGGCCGRDQDTNIPRGTLGDGAGNWPLWSHAHISWQRDQTAATSPDWCLGNNFSVGEVPGAEFGLSQAGEASWWVQAHSHACWQAGACSGGDAGAIHCHHPTLLVMAPHPQQPPHAAHHCWLLLCLVLLSPTAFSAGLPPTQDHPPSFCAVDQIYPDTGLPFCWIDFNVSGQFTVCTNNTITPSFGVFVALPPLYSFSDLMYKLSSHPSHGWKCWWIPNPSVNPPKRQLIRVFLWAVTHWQSLTCTIDQCSPSMLT